MGRPEEIAAVERSHTGRWLRPLLHLDDGVRPAAARLDGRRAAERGLLDRAARIG
jgi:hypothetical protein